ncbi:hypothetical protein ACLOJK_015029 [Asimina triloba]
MIEDLDVIRESYGIPSSIILSALVLHETSNNHCPGHLCLNKCMLRAGVRIPFDFGVAEALWGLFGRSVPMEEAADLSVVLRDVKVIGNPPNHVSGWESRFFFAQLSSERDTWDIPQQWEELLSDPIPRSHRWALMYFWGTVLRWHPSTEELFQLCESARFIVVEAEEQCAPKRVHPSEEGSISMDSNSSTEEASRRVGASQPSLWDLVVRPGSEDMVLPSIVAQLREELEASRVEVARLQSMLQGDDIRSSVMAEYLQNYAYRRRMEFEQAHHSQSGYVRALLDMATLYPKVDLSPLYRPS